MSLENFDKMRGEMQMTAPGVQKTTVRARERIVNGKPVTNADNVASYAGAGKPKTTRTASARNILVNKIMAEKQLSLPMASKYIKEHSLY